MFFSNLIPTISTFANMNLISFLDYFIIEIDEFVLVGLIILFSFFGTFFLIKKWINIAESAKILGKDMNKPEKPLIPRSGGLIVVVIICFSLLIYIFLKTFSILGSPSTNIVEAFAISSTILLAGFIGFVDDILGWKTGLSQLQKVILTLPIALPLTVLNVDQTVMALPFFGNINLGIIYPILIVPLGVIGATNGFNLLAGYNGLEAGMGIVIFATFGFTGLVIGRLWITLIAVIVCSSLLAFIFFNWYPAKVFPGNSFSYAIGALIATLAILGNMETIAVWLFIPYFIEILLYLRARFIDGMGDVQAFAKPNPDGTLELPYDHKYDTTHLAIWILKRIKKRVYEKDVVISLLTIQILLAISGIIFLL